MRDSENVRLDPNLAGGSLIDVRCYTVNAARLFLGDRARIRDSDGHHELWRRNRTNGRARIRNGITAELSSGFTTTDTQFYRVEAANGWLESQEAFVPRGDDGTRLEYRIDDRHVIEEFNPTNQYALEVEESVNCIETGRSPETDATDESER
ncbi:hypothetical protein [Haladaptatus sp. W1]|uniref:hypothetical protein n=1 Tax=Haladaptatus sp. W1 TaxID=1897478 RepID=UPI0020C7EE9A|nr:hypothetical protein [Haladaptatus sp. W1]